MQAYLDVDEIPPMPDLTGHQSSILCLFQEVGPTGQGAMGEVPLTWAEVDAFTRLSPEITEPWEARILVQMSRDYLTEKGLGADPFRKGPLERGG
jgi:hypothetical protein